jgi:hypothetical protein
MKHEDCGWQEEKYRTHGQIGAPTLPEKGLWIYENQNEKDDESNDGWENKSCKFLIEQFLFPAVEERAIEDHYQVSGQEHPDYVLERDDSQ